MIVVFTTSFAIRACTTEVVSLDPAQARCTRYNIIGSSLSVTCGNSVVFFRIPWFPPPIKLIATI